MIHTEVGSQFCSKTQLFLTRMLGTISHCFLTLSGFLVFWNHGICCHGSHRSLHCGTFYVLPVPGSTNSWMSSLSVLMAAMGETKDWITVKNCYTEFALVIWMVWKCSELGESVLHVSQFTTSLLALVWQPLHSCYEIDSS